MFIAGRHRAEVPHRPHPVDLADGAVRDARQPARRRPRPPGARRPHPRRHRRVPQAAPRSTSASRSSGSAYVAWTRARHRAAGLGLVLLAQAQGRSRPVGLPRGHASRRWPAGAAAPEPWCDRPAKDTPNPYASLDPDLPWPMSHHTPEVAAPARGGGAGRRGLAGAVGRPAVGRRDRRHAGARPHPGLGRRAVPAPRGGDPRPVTGGRRTPAVEPVRDRAGAAARRPRRVRGRPGAADAAPARLPRRGSAPGSTPGWRVAVRPAATCSTRTTCRAAPTPASTTTPTCRS